MWQLVGWMVVWNFGLSHGTVQQVMPSVKVQVPVSTLFEILPFLCKVLVRQWDRAHFALVLKFFIKRYAKHLN
jgi:hypothetical protein